jgi:hypothetical protein
MFRSFKLKAQFSEKLLRFRYPSNDDLSAYFCVCFLQFSLEDQIADVVDPGVPIGGHNGGRLILLYHRRTNDRRLTV